MNSASKMEKFSDVNLSFHAFFFSVGSCTPPPETTKIFKQANVLYFQC